MEKSDVVAQVSKLKAQGIENFYIRCENNRVFYNNGDTSKIVFHDNYYTVVELSRNKTTEYTGINVITAGYETIFYVCATDLTMDAAIKLLKTMDGNDFTTDVETMFKNSSARMTLKPGTDGLAPRKDKDGNTLIGKGTVGYVTPGEF